MNRRGLVTLCVLTCLLVTLSIVLTLMQATLRARREATVRMQIQQTEWLLDAGVRLADQRLAESKNYRGETWQLDDVIPGYYAANVVITVDSGNDEQASVEVIAQLSNCSLAGKHKRGMVTQRSYRWEKSDPFSPGAPGEKGVKSKIIHSYNQEPQT